MLISSNENAFRYQMRLPKKLPRKIKFTFSKYSSKNGDLYNPEPIPYQREIFQPSTICKVISIPKRLIDGFLEDECIDNNPQRGIILHTERYIWSTAKESHKSQNERLIAEENYLKKVKYLKKMSENRFKNQNPNFVLEGENVMPSSYLEKLDVTPTSPNKIKIRIPTMVNNVENYQPTHKAFDTSNLTGKELGESNSCQPVSVDVQKIKLKNRMPGSEIIPSFSPQDNSNRNTKYSFNSLPPISGGQRYADSNYMKSITYIDNSPDHDIPEQRETLTRPIVRINEYKIGGITMKFTERADIQGELRYLKSIVLPTVAKELYVGRGIQLPPNHATKIPRGKYVENKPNVQL